MSTCSDYLDDIDTCYDNAYNGWDGVAYWAGWLYDNIATWQTGTWHLNLVNCLDDISYTLQNLVMCSPTYSLPYRVPYYLRNCVGGGGVTMDDMLNSMLTATFDQLTKFIGLVDAYRIAVWNAPFNAEFYAALARGFIKWQPY